jgi:ribosomal protein S18 acetylase RimI-like enzyme
MALAGIHDSDFVEIRRENHQSPAGYAMISAAFEIREVLQSPAVGPTQPPLVTRAIGPNHLKDYDAIPGNHPRDWPSCFVVERACVLGAYANGVRVGGAVVILDPRDIARLGGEPDLALLWDLRVAPHVRRRGIGRALLAGAEVSAREAGARGIAVETQDTNVAACQSYAAAGFAVAHVELDAYPDLPGEARMVWTKSLIAEQRN